MRGQCEIESATQSIRIGTYCGTGAARVLFLWCIARCSLMANKKERASAISSGLCVAEVYQNSSAVRSDTDIIGFDITVNDGWMLVMQKHHRIADGKYPVQNAWQRNSIISLPCNANDIGEVAALDVAQYHIIVSTLAKSLAKCGQVWMVQVAQDAGLMLQLCLST